MSFVSSIIGTAERVPLPDIVIRAAIQRLCSRTATRLASGNAESDASFADEMAARHIAEYTDGANAQRYEVPQAFFAHVLGPNRKYSSGFYKEPESTLREAEEESLRQTVEHADLHDGQSILELGCGWGSLSLWMARQFPKSRVTAVSNSHSQRIYIEAEAAARGLKNLRVITQDMNVFDPKEKFDRIVSVEMFERMMNWRELMMRIQSWLKPDGRLFLHIFTHRAGAYRFDPTDKEDWIAQHFFTGGVMPTCWRSKRNGAGAACIISAPRRTGWRISTRTARRSTTSCARSMAATRTYGCAAGAGSSSQPQACSATPPAANGASAITGCGWGSVTRSPCPGRSAVRRSSP
jgi:cyclopropane-fatty-acyl-phospholipid synthase